MAWKLKKWKSTEAEEQEAPEEGFEIADEAPAGNHTQVDEMEQPPVFTEPEPSEVFNAAQFAQDDAPAKPPSVIAMPPPTSADSQPAEPADQEPDFTAQPPLHDLDSSIETDVEPIDFSAPPAGPAPGAPAHDYFAASASTDHSAFTQFQPEPAEEAEATATSHVEFDLDAAPQEPVELPAASFEPPPAAPAPPAASSVPPAAKPTPAREVEADSMDAFAPYRPASAPPPASDRAAAPGNSAQQMPPTADSADTPFTPVPTGSENGQEYVHAAGAQNYEETLSFAPVATGRVVVKIGPFTAPYEINRPEMTIGRPDTKTGTSPDISLEWDDAVSRRHARILKKSDGDYIEDVGSSNGTLLNGQPIAVGTPILLKDGDTITIGERTQISYLK